MNMNGDIYSGKYYNVHVNVLRGHQTIDGAYTGPVTGLIYEQKEV